MMGRKRGRPPANINKQSISFPVPPEYINVRIKARGGIWDRRWQEVLVGMDEFDARMEKFRQRHRLTQQAAWTLLLHQEGVIPTDAIETILDNAPKWKSTGARGGSAATKKRRQWEEVVDKKWQPAQHRHSAARAADIILKNWPEDSCPKPCERSLRSYISKQQKISGK